MRSVGGEQPGKRERYREAVVGRQCRTHGQRQEMAVQQARTGRGAATSELGSEARVADRLSAAVSAAI